MDSAKNININYTTISFALRIVFILMFACNLLSAKEYTGMVTPLIKSKINSGTDADFNGVIMHVARVGEIVKPEIVDNNNNIVQRGTPLIILNPDYWQGAVLVAQTNIDSAKADLVTAEHDYIRYKTLVQSHSESMQEYEARRAKYYEVKSNLQSWNIQLLQAKAVLKACYTIAPFEGIVDNVLLASGLAAGQPPVIEISQLNPIGINVEMTREEADKISITTPVTIYSNRTGKPYGVYNMDTLLTKNGVTFFAENFRVYSGETIAVNGKKARLHKEIHSVAKFPSEGIGVKLSVPLKAIRKDNKGFFVWNAVGNSTNAPGVGMKSVFPVSKVYIIPDNMKTLIAGFLELQALKNPGKLKRNNIVLYNPPDDLKDGDLIYTHLDRYIFMPGDKIKVVIGE